MPAPIRTARAAGGRAKGAPVWSSTEVTSMAGAERHGDISQNEGPAPEFHKPFQAFRPPAHAPEGLGPWGGARYDRHARQDCRATCPGEWRSLVAHPAGGRAVAGSNPVSPTTQIPASEA